jgi:hypothetical protein
VKARWSIASLATVAVLCAAYTDLTSAQQKIDSIEAGRLRPGSRVTLSYPELAAWTAHKAPDGVRNPQLRVNGPGVVTGSALIDFAKVQKAQGQEPGWLMAKLLAGERPVSVTARIRSSGGTATVDVQRVEIGGLSIDGSTLDFLIRNVLLPMYPNAVVGRPFVLGDRIERLDVQPNGVIVAIRK